MVKAGWSESQTELCPVGPSVAFSPWTLASLPPKGWLCTSQGCKTRTSPRLFPLGNVGSIEWEPSQVLREKPPHLKGLTHPRGVCGSARGQAGPSLQCWKRTVYEGMYVWQRSPECSEVWPLSTLKNVVLNIFFSSLAFVIESSQCCCCGSYSLG